MTLGRLVFDEVPCEVTAIRLEAGEVVVYAEADGAHRVHNSADFALFGPDGELIVSGAAAPGDRKMVESGAGYTLTVRQGFSVHDKRAEDRR